MKSLIFAVAVVLLAGAAQAESISYSNSAPLQAFIDNNAGAVLPLPKFDPNQGELLSVEIAVTGTLSNTWKMENQQDMPVAAGWFGASVEQALGVGVNTVPVLTMWLMPEEDYSDGSYSYGIRTYEAMAAFDGTSDFFGSSATSGIVNQVTESASMSFENIQDFIGTDDFNVDFGAYSWTSVADLPSGVDFVLDSAAGATATVTYTYVPEPSALCLLGAGAAVMAIFRRRRVAQ